MIALLACALIIGVFLSGAWFAMHTIGSLVLLGAAVICLGVLFAAAETRGFNGQIVHFKRYPAQWTDLWLAVTRLAVERDKMSGHEDVYVLTDAGPVPVTGLFTCRINGVAAIVFDTAQDEDPTHTFNALKQGVM